MYRSSKVSGRAALRHGDMPPRRQRSKNHEETADAFADMFVVFPHRMARLGWLRRQRLSAMGKQMLAPFIQANGQTLGVERATMDIQVVFHIAGKRLRVS